ncbi:MAG: HD domain-containing protein [Oscillospiraceae bacterium]|nr:HD domain-containing protein [Oscillospiraceae bacterium]
MILLISRKLANKLFDAFSIYRWNDRIRPINLVEMDKQAHKAVLAFVIASMEDKEATPIDWEYIVDGIVFALLKNIVLSDIKSTVISKIKSDYPDDYKELNKWVVEQYKEFIEDENVLKKFEEFLINDSENVKLELSILKAAHKYSSKREFDIIKRANDSFPRIDIIEKTLNEEVEEFKHLKAISMLEDKENRTLFNAMCLIEQLRYQVRWSQTPRIPQTSVLGHSMYVALLMYFLSKKLGACKQRLVNNFFAALFHDLPESVTRDIISPVKQATDNFPKIIKEIEKKICDEELYPKFPDHMFPNFLPRLKYLMGDLPEIDDEFCNRIIRNNKVEKLNDKTNVNKIYNENIYDLVDGRLIKVCDDVAAFMEATKSRDHGITSKQIQDGIAGLTKKYMRTNKISGVDVKEFFIEFYTESFQY